MPQLPPIPSLIFDLDGTLIDSCPGIRSALSAAFQSIGRVMPETNMRSVIGPPIQVIAARVDPTLSQEELKRIETSYRSRYDNEGWRETVLFEEVDPVLRELYGQGLALYIVTNKPLIPTRNILEHVGLLPVFREIVTRDSRTPFFGSKAEMLGYLLERHALGSDSTIMIGDTAEDAEAARHHRLSFIHASYGYGCADGAHGTITNFTELTSVLKNLVGREGTTSA